MIALCSSVFLVVTGRGDWFERAPMAALLSAIVIHVAINVLLIRSRKIQHLAQTASSGG